MGDDIGELVGGFVGDSVGGSVGAVVGDASVFRLVTCNWWFPGDALAY